MQNTNETHGDNPIKTISKPKEFSGVEIGPNILSAEWIEQLYRKHVERAKHLTNIRI
jgi:hypothetical protein